jgi:hypothetical protein
MRHYVKPECKHGCRFLLITPALWLCPHSAYGEASYLRGAVEQAREMLERSGGYVAVLAGVEAGEAAKKKKASDERRESRRIEPPASKQVRYE